MAVKELMRYLWYWFSHLDNHGCPICGNKTVYHPHVGFDGGCMPCRRCESLGYGPEDYQGVKRHGFR